jgi:hypothetical protein
MLHTYNRVEKSSKENSKTLCNENTHEAHQEHHEEPVPFQRLGRQEVRYRDVHYTVEQLENTNP